MTEYDFSPEAYDAYIRKQHQIARWVDKTNRAPALRDPFTAATPALRARDIDQDDHRDRRRHNHRRHTSVDHTAYQRDQYAKDRDRERDRDRDRDKDRERDRPRDRDKERYNSASPTRLPPKRHRSASHAAVSPPLPDNTRKYSVPPPLPLPAQYPAVHSPTQPFQQPQHPYPSRMISPRDSRHSSHSSSTQIPSPTSYYPQQQPPYSAPVYKSTHAPVRSQTAPNYYFQEPNYPYPSQYHQSQNFYPVKPTQYDNFNPYPYSAQQPKQPPLLKRIFMGLTGGNKQHHKVPRRKRSSSF